MKKVVPGTGETTIFVYDASGKQVAEYSTIVETTTPKVSYLTSDHLGSPRINTDQNGAVTARHDYQPFGEEISRTSYGADDVRKQFTSYERDNEIDLDFAQNRYYNKNLGRFTNPDPLLSSGRTFSPQSWNRFAYVLNNPLNFIDPDGLYECKSTAPECSAFRQNLANAQAKITDIIEKYGEGSDEHVQAEKALGSYGCESKGGNCIGADGKELKDENGNSIKDTASNVQVSFDWAGTSTAHTSTNTTTGIIKVQFGKGNESNLGILANEGINAADMQNALRTGVSVSEYQSEKDGLFVQAVFGELRAEARGSVSSFFGTKEEERFTYWKKSWETSDHEKVRAGRESAIVTRLRENYGLTPRMVKPLVDIPKGYKPKN